MIDLHVHTTVSDGVLEPEKMIKKAKEFGLTAIGICDHDQIGGIAPAILAGRKEKIEVIPGVELSCYWIERNRKEFHILGYFLDFKNEKLLRRLKFFQNERKKRAKKIMKIFLKLGYYLEWDNLLRLAEGTIGKPHIARAIFESPKNKRRLLNKFGKLPSVGEFIEEYMVPGKEADVEKAGFEPKEAIDLIHEARGVAVLAHPGFDIEMGDNETIRIFKKWGLDGLEVFAPIKTPERTRVCIKYFAAVAKKYGFLITGGSDYHAPQRDNAGLGMLNWQMGIKEQVLVNLKSFYKRKFG